jgi:hypothetical protein
MPYTSTESLLNQHTKIWKQKELNASAQLVKMMLIYAIKKVNPSNTVMANARIMGLAFKEN